MKFKRLLILILALLAVIGLVACDTPSNGGKTTTEEPVPTLDDLIDYSSNTKYYNVTPVTYSNTQQQKNLLQERIDDKSEDEDPSVPVKIFINSSPDEIIDAMSQAGLSFDKMDKTVKYLAGAEDEAVDLDAIAVPNGNWVDDDDWSFFDDWDYYERLEDLADASDSTDKDSDNFQRQKRKMMRQVFEIGLTGDEFARLVYEELKYAQTVSHDMHLGNTELQSKQYDDFVKAELSFDTLVYFKAFDEFSVSKAKTVQLYGYYYDYDKKAYDSTDDATFEKQLQYSHQNIFTDPEFLDYIDIQRKSYVNSYRYKDSFYRKFYDVHFQFQGLLEGYDISVYDISSAITADSALRYSTEMKRGMDAGFTQQLILTDHLYNYSANNTVMKAYNSANTAYERVKDGAVNLRDEKEMLLNIEQLKIVDYILTKMNDQQLSKVLQYHIMSYSGDMIRNIQSEQKDRKLEEVTLDGIDDNIINEPAIKASTVKIGRTSAIIAQLRNSYSEAAPESQFSTATGTNWKGIRPEVKAALDHNYNQYADGTKKKEAFDDMLIKKKWDCGGANDDDCKLGNGHLTCNEDYDETHQISRFLKNHETVLRYTIGQVEVSLASIPGKHAEANTSYNLNKNPINNAIGTYANGNDLEGRNMPDGAVSLSYVNTLDSLNFESGLTLREAMDENNDTKNFLTANAGKVALAEQTYQGGSGPLNRKYKYTFEGWYIDMELKYKIDENEKVKYDMRLYPGYSVQVSNV